MPPLFIPPPLASSRILPTLCVDGRGEYHLWIARYRCQECRKTVSVLPSFLLPYVQYTRSVIWQAVKTWLETPRRGAKTKQVGFPTKEVILFYVRRFLRNLSRLHHAAARRWGIIGPVGNARTERAVWWMQTLEGRGWARSSKTCGQTRGGICLRIKLLPDFLLNTKNGDG